MVPLEIHIFRLLEHCKRIYIF